MFKKLFATFQIASPWIVLALFIIAAIWQIYGWYQFRNAMIANTKIITIYMQNDNQKLLNRILNPQTAPATPPVVPSPTVMPGG